MVTVIDLADYDVPARCPAEPTATRRSFVQEVSRADLLVVVTPEYNHSLPASFNRRSTVRTTIAGRAIGVVSYGCRSIGLHAVDQLRPVFTTVHAVTVRDVVGVDPLRGEPTPLGAGQLRQDGGARPDQLCW